MQLTATREVAAALFRKAAQFTERHPEESAFLGLVATKGRPVSVVTRAPLGCVRLPLPAEVSNSGSIVARADMLAGLSAHLGTDLIALGAGKSCLTVRAGAGHYRVPVIAKAEAWLNGVDLHAALAEKHGADLPAADVVGALDFALHAAARNDLRSYLMGVLFHVERTSFAAVGCDGHRLARRLVTLEHPVDGEWRDTIIPLAAAQRLAANLSTEGNLRWYSDGVQYYVRDETGFEFSGRALQGRFPDYETVIPPDPAQGEAQVADLAAAAERAAILSAGYQRLHLTCGARGLVVSSSDQVSGTEDVLGGSWKGEVDTAVNTAYLREALGALASASETSVQVYLPPEESVAVRLQTDDGGCLCIIMPVRR